MGFTCCGFKVLWYFGFLVLWGNIDHRSVFAAMPQEQTSGLVAGFYIVVRFNAELPEFGAMA
jgi:hypothetical protein